MIHEFVCQTKQILRGAKTISLTYKKDQLNFPSFFVWYKYKAASQQLLDSWKDKRMTGFRLSWRIENPPFVANISEVGRSIESPRLLNTFDASLNYTYKAILTPSEELLQQMENESLVIELNFDMNSSDEAYAFTCYRPWQ